ncbi:MAG: MFS transporter [Desulfobacterales bacterium]|nr:MFS transporter [Desulfobacterales bacterium]
MRLLLIILSQFLSGAIWFAGNVAFQGQGLLLSAVQAGFIAGTLSFAVLNVADRFSPARFFLVSAVLGGMFNAIPLWFEGNDGLLLMSRFACGICLAGIYPVGMKIAASWYPDTLGRALGLLVGALVLASGFPYLLKVMSWQGSAAQILGTTSLLCITGGFIQAFMVGDGPALPKGSAFNIRAIRDAFAHPGFRAASLGYFGHMWELYALWAFIPLLFKALVPGAPDAWTFAFFLVGFMGCSAGGLISLKIGSRRIASMALAVSAACCLISPLFHRIPLPVALILLMGWGMAVVTDSPQFSALNARFAPRAYVGSALTIVNCIGFFITILSIELLDLWISAWGIRYAFLPLALGPLFGWLSMHRMPKGITGHND